MIVEDGTGVTDADSYVSLAEADAFHLARNNTGWTGTDAVKEAALIRATDYIEQNYAQRWAGDAVYEDQSLSWPRDALTGIPKGLKFAVCVLALEALTADLNPALERGGAVKREKVDVIETEYFESAAAGTVRPAVEGYLRGLISGSALNARVYRV